MLFFYIYVIMKIKKLNELREFSDEELQFTRNRRFNETSMEYHLWGEHTLSFTPTYSKIHTEYSLEAILNYYKENINDKRSRFKAYDNIILTSEETIIKLLDVDLLISSTIYNL